MTGAKNRGARCAAREATRAELLIASGLVDVAAGIADFANSLTTSAVEVIETRMSEWGDGSDAATDFDFLRRAVFSGIAQNLIDRVEQKLRAEPKKPDLPRLTHNRSPRATGTKTAVKTSLNAHDKVATDADDVT